MQFSADNSGQSTSRKRTKNTPIRKLTARALAVTLAFFCAVNILALQPPARTTRTVVTTEKIPYSVAYQDEPARYRGYTEVVSAGIAGEREIRSQVVFEGDRRSRCCRSSRPTQHRLPIES